MKKILALCLLLSGCATAHVVGVVLPTKPNFDKCGTYAKFDLTKPITTRDVKLVYKQTKVTLEECQDIRDAESAWIDNLYRSAK